MSARLKMAYCSSALTFLLFENTFPYQIMCSISSVYGLKNSLFSGAASELVNWKADMVYFSFRILSTFLN